MKIVAMEGAMLSTLVAEVEHGAEIILTKHNMPVAKLTSVTADSRPPIASESMVAERKVLLEEIRAAGGFSAVIDNPEQWQREMRIDRPLPAPIG